MRSRWFWATKSRGTRCLPGGIVASLSESDRESAIPARYQNIHLMSTFFLYRKHCVLLALVHLPFLKAAIPRQKVNVCKTGRTDVGNAQRARQRRGDGPRSPLSGTARPGAQRAPAGGDPLGQRRARLRAGRGQARDRAGAGEPGDLLQV